MLIIQRVIPDLMEASKLTAVGFKQSLTQDLVKDVENHLQAGEIVYSIQEEEKIIGFAVFQLIANQILYLAGIMLSPESQASGIAKKVILKAKEETGAVYFSLRTQSSRMWSVGSHLCSPWLPCPQNEENQELAQLTKQVALNIGMPDNIVPGFYGHPLYGEKPLHHDLILQKWWDSLCVFERGDAILCLGKFA